VTSIRPLEAAPPAPLWTSLAVAALWPVIMRAFPQNVYVALGLYALSVLLVLGALERRRLSRLLAPSWLAVLSGVGIGLGMTLVTYPLFDLASALLPGLDVEVEELYRAARSMPMSAALGWVLVIILAEEVLWRGVLLDALRARYALAWAFTISVVTYGLAQLGAGSLVLGAIALACGMAWTLLRLASGSLLAPLIAHLIWTPTVILLYPVT
jgi:uncharacterized protein